MKMLFAVLFTITFICNSFQNFTFNQNEEEYFQENNRNYNEYDWFEEEHPEIFSETNQIVESQFRNLLKLDDAETNYTKFLEFIPTQFMLDLYKVVTDPETGITIQNNPHGASVVWSIPEKNPTTTNLFHFDLPELEDDEEVIEAELHIYRAGLIESISPNQSSYYLLRVYQIMPNKSLDKNPDVHQLLNVHYVSASTTGWQIFRVKRAIQDWLENKRTNLGLLVTANTISNDPLKVEFIRAATKQGNLFQPTLILFTQNKKQKSVNIQPNQNLEYFENRICNRQSLYLNFSLFDFHPMIIAPKGFEMYECVGNCRFPIDLNQTIANNHAVLQSIMAFQTQTITHTCCVPHNLKPLSVLQFDATFNMKLIKLDDMVVSNCACH